METWDNSYREFYIVTRERLTEKMSSWNEGFCENRHPLLLPFRRDFADLNEGGKMLRGVLVCLGAFLAGTEHPSDADPLALAFELFQTGVLIHDDVIDHAESRRGKKTIHRRYGDRLRARVIPMVSQAETPESMGMSAALCMGDAGLYEANAMIAGSYAGDPRCGRLLLYFDTVVLNTIEGELLDVVLPVELMDPSLNEEERCELLNQSVRRIYEMKTSWYSVVGPMHLGMMLGNLSDEEMKTVDQFADDLGIAYQIEDDILGIYGDEETMGKDIGSDVSEYKQTVLYAFVRTAEDKKYWNELRKFYGKENLSREELTTVRDIFMASGAYDNARKLSDSCYKDAENRLDNMTFLSPEKKRLLQGLIASLRGRNH